MSTGSGTSTTFPPPKRSPTDSSYVRDISHPRHLGGVLLLLTTNYPAPSTTATASPTIRMIPTPRTGTMPGTSGPRSRPRALAYHSGNGDIPRTSETRAPVPSLCSHPSPSPIPLSPLGARRRTSQGIRRGHTVPSTMTRIEARSTSSITITRNQCRLAQNSRPSPKQNMSRGAMGARREEEDEQGW
jgi:hypothetical protein